MQTLRDFHTAAPKAGNASKIIGAAVLAAVIGGILVYGYSSGLWNSPAKSAVSDSELPSPGPLPVAPSNAPPAT